MNPISFSQNMKDFFIAKVVDEVFGPCSIKIEHVRNYQSTTSGVVEKNPNERAINAYVRRCNWVSKNIRTYVIRIIMYETPFLQGSQRINTVCCFEGAYSDPWVQQHWEHSDFYATTSKEFKKNLLLWKEEIMKF